METRFCCLSKDILMTYPIVLLELRVEVNWSWFLWNLTWKRRFSAVGLRNLLLKSSLHELSQEQILQLEFVLVGVVRHIHTSAARAYSVGADRTGIPSQNVLENQKSNTMINGLNTRPQILQGPPASHRLTWSHS